MELRKLIEGLKKNGLKAEAAREIAILQYSDAAKVDEAMREFYPESKPVVVAPEKREAPAPVINSNHRDYSVAMDIATLCQLSDCPERAVAFINERKTVDEVRTVLLAEKAASRQANGPQRVNVGADETDKFRNSAIASIMLRSNVDEKHIEGGVVESAKIRQSGLMDMTLMDLCKRSIEIRGEKIPHGRDRIIARALSSTDFPYIIGTGSNRVLGTAYQEAPSTFQSWTKPLSVSDFKSTDIVKRSGFSNLDTVLEGAGYNQNKVLETKETGKLVTLGNICTLTRQMIYNDDLGAFTGMLQGIGMAAKRTLNKASYQLLFTTDTLVDGQVLFVGTTTLHKNLLTAAAIANTSVQQGVQFLKRQTDPNGNVLNLSAKYFLVNTAKEYLAQQYLGTFPVAYSTGTSIDPYRGLFTIISDAEMDNGVASPTAWAMVADPRICDFVNVMYLNGRQEPELFQSESDHKGEADGIIFKARFDAKPVVADFRGAVLSRGA